MGLGKKKGGAFEVSLGEADGVLCVRDVFRYQRRGRVGGHVPLFLYILALLSPLCLTTDLIILDVTSYLDLSGTRSRHVFSLEKAELYWSMDPKFTKKFLLHMNILTC